MSARPSAEHVRNAVSEISQSGQVVDAESIADYLKETHLKYRRFKRNILARLVTPVLSAHMATSSLNISMNESLHNLYRTQTGGDSSSSHITDENPKKSSRKRDETTDLNHNSKRRKSRSPTESTSLIGKKGTGREFLPEESAPNFTLATLGGVDRVIKEIRELVIRPLKHREVYERLGVSPVCGVLLHGPPGSGKTKLALAVAGEAGVPFFKISGPEIVTGVSGESEGLLRSLFEAAKSVSPSLIFIDEIDTICPKRENASREMERRIVAQLGTCMDNLAESSVVVLAATNRADALDPMIRRNGRFDREIAMGIPDEAARAKILAVLVEGIRIASDVDFGKLGKLTPGFVGADLEAIAKEAALLCVNRVFGDILPEQDDVYSTEQLDPLAICHADFVAALRNVQPSAKREGFATTPDVSFDDVGGLSGQRKELEDQICHPIREAVLYEKLGITVPAGILLFGPPGCGKTLLAKAVASESGANFIAVKGPELLNKYVGESERAIRQVFQRARMSAPCIIFFDELDSLCCRRGTEGNAASERVVNQLLTEMDGVQERKNVYVVAATNRPELIDPAMLRPGRLDRLVCVPLPDMAKRADILQRLSRKTRLDESIDYNTISQRTEGFSGADLAALLRQAVLLVLEEYRTHKLNTAKRLDLSADNQIVQECSTCTNRMEDDVIETLPPKISSLPNLKEIELEEDKLCVRMEHLLKALDTVKPSVTKEHIEHYNRVYYKMKNSIEHA